MGVGSDYQEYIIVDGYRPINKSSHPYALWLSLLDRSRDHYCMDGSTGHPPIDKTTGQCIVVYYALSCSLVI